MAARLNISEVTVARLCRKGSLDADKTTGNQWRTTEERLRRSPYLKGKKRGGGGNGQLE
jgi:predicted site-specific integrase-resolvase